MAHPISVAEQAMKLFVMQWFNGLKPSLYLSTKSDGSIVMTSEVASFSAPLQVPPNVSHSGRRSGHGARNRRRNSRAANSNNLEVNNSTNNCNSTMEQNHSRAADIPQGSSVANIPTVSSTPQKLQSEQLESIDAPRDLMNISNFSHSSQPSFPCSPANALSNQVPINCIRAENGCPNLITSYYNRYTAICATCENFLEEKLKSTPFSHSLCPCCHKPTEVLLSLCSECLIDIEDDGWVETGWGSWHLDRKLGKIVCISLGT